MKQNRLIVAIFILTLFFPLLLAGNDLEETAARDNIIFTRAFEKITTETLNLKGKSAELEEKRILTDIFHLWIIYKSEFRFKGTPGEFETKRFSIIKRNAKNSGIKLSKGDPIGWGKLLDEQQTIGEVITGAEMLPPRLRGGRRETYDKLVTQFTAWWDSE